MKNYIIGFCFLAGAFFLIWKQSEEQIERAKESNPPSSSQSDSNFTAAVMIPTIPLSKVIKSCW